MYLDELQFYKNIFIAVSKLTFHIVAQIAYLTRYVFVVN